MYRISIIAIASLFISAVLVAKAPAAEPLSVEPPNLETVMFRVMVAAFSVNDYETIETLFDKLSPEDKKRFLFGAATMADDKNATKFLARLTLSLFEQPAAITPQVAVYSAHPVYQPLPSIHNSYHPVPVKLYQYPPQVGLTAPPAYVPFVPGNDDDYLDLSPHGRVYVKGLSADERREAINSHLSQYIEESPRAGGAFERLYHVGDLVEYMESQPIKTIDVLMLIVAPKSGTMDTFADAQCVIIRQTEEAHAELENTLNAMRQFIKAETESQTLKR